MKKSVSLALTALALVVAPAFAQSFNPRDGTGNVLPYSFPS